MKTKLYFFFAFILFSFISYGQIRVVGNSYTGTDFHGCDATVFKFYTVGNSSSGQSWNNDNGFIGVPNGTDSPSWSFGLLAGETIHVYTITTGVHTATVTIVKELDYLYQTVAPFHDRKGCYPFKFKLEDVTLYHPGIFPLSRSWTYSGYSNTGQTIQGTIPFSTNYYHTPIMSVTTNPASCSKSFSIPDFYEILDTPIAKIGVTDTASCAIPFILDLQNLSSSQMSQSNLTYLWSWSKPFPQTSTNSVPSPGITYNSKLTDIVTLTTTNQFGCKTSAKINIIIDTPLNNIKFPDTMCISDTQFAEFLNYDLNYTFSFNSSTFDGIGVYQIGFNVYLKNSVPSGFYEFSITKQHKTNLNCKSTKVKKVYIINDYPKIALGQDDNCNIPISDTIKVLTNPIPEWVEEIKYSLTYMDKTLKRIKYDTITLPSSNLKRIVVTSIYDELDSNYRLGGLIGTYSATYISNKYKCKITTNDTIDNENLFHVNLVDSMRKGCIGFQDSFIVYTYANHKIQEVRWHWGDGSPVENSFSDTTRYHTFNAVGKFKVYAVVTSTNGCVDTSNPVWVERGDPPQPNLVPQFNTICASNMNSFNLTNSSSFDEWSVVTDDYRRQLCGSNNPTNYTNHKFENVGMQKVYIIAEKYGCRRVDSIVFMINSPKFKIGYDFKCTSRDTFKFYVSDTQLSDPNIIYNWDFGNGQLRSGKINDTFKIGYVDSFKDYFVKLRPTGFVPFCNLVDSNLIHIRKMKPYFYDTIFCIHIDSTQLFNGFPYIVDPRKTMYADYMCEYTYTWIVEDGSIALPPYTGSSTMKIDLPKTNNPLYLTLISRDANGCESSYRKEIKLSDNKPKIHINKAKFCAPIDTLILSDSSFTPFKTIKREYTIETLTNTNKFIQIVIKDSSTTKLVFPLNSNSMGLYFRAYIKVSDTFCSTKYDTVYFNFIQDTSHVNTPSSICEASSDQIVCTENNIAEYKYRWEVLSMGVPMSLAANDTFAGLKQKIGVGNLYNIKLLKTNRLYGCKNLMQLKTDVKPKPRVRVNHKNTKFCFPAIDTFEFFDSANVVNVTSPNQTFYFDYEGLRTAIWPMNIYTLNHGGINTIKALFYTNYGCRDSFKILDTVIKPSAQIVLDKNKICLGDRINFTLKNPVDIDTVIWLYGDGESSKDTTKYSKHNYTKPNLFSDDYQATVTFLAKNGACPQISSIPLVIQTARSGFFVNDGIDTIICYDKIKITNTALRADSFIWHYGDGNSDKNKTTPFYYQFATPGKYKITQIGIRKPLGCPDTTIHHYILNPIPMIVAKNDTVCEGDTVKIDFTDTVLFPKVYIYPDFFNKNPHYTSPIKSIATKNINYTLVSVGGNNCTDTARVSAKVIPNFKEPSLDTTIETGHFVTIPIQNNSDWRYTWTPNLLNPTCQNCARPNIQVFNPSIYNLSISDIYGCFTNLSKYIINLYPEINIKVPTAFTPNGDGHNDILFAKTYGVKRLLFFKIFNRVGQLIFMTTDENQGWDGYYKGALQNSEPYFYTFEAESYVPGKIVSGDGNFILLK